MVSLKLKVCNERLGDEVVHFEIGASDLAGTVWFYVLNIHPNHINRINDLCLGEASRALGLGS